MLSQSRNDAAEETFDPLADPAPALALTIDLVPYIAGRTLKQFNPDTFRAVYTVAIEEGLTSRQKLKELFGAEVVDILRKPNRIPNPAICRQILSFLSTLNPEKAKGMKEPHRHSKPREEPAPVIS